MIEGGTFELSAGLASVSIPIEVTPGSPAELIQGMLFSVIVDVGDGSEPTAIVLLLAALTAMTLMTCWQKHRRAAAVQSTDLGRSVSRNVKQ